MNHIFTPEFVFSLTLHVTILFFILSCIFVIYISKITTTTINRELVHVANSLFSNINLTDIISGPSSFANDLGIDIKNNFPYHYYEELYSTEDTNKARINDIVISNIIFTNIFLFGITIVIGLLLIYFSDLTYSGILSALIENIITFSAVGAFEVFFFVNVILFYIPTPPSLLYESLYTNLKNKFNSTIN